MPIMAVPTGAPSGSETPERYVLTNNVPSTGRGSKPYASINRLTVGSTPSRYVHVPPPIVFTPKQGRETNKLCLTVEGKYAQMKSMLERLSG